MKCVKPRLTNTTAPSAEPVGRSLYSSYILCHIAHTNHLYSCSLPCFKAHQQSCHWQGHSTNNVNLAINPALETATAPPAPSSMEELQKLFRDHPQLRQTLRSVYAETLDPGQHTASDRRSRYGRHEARWTEEKGFDQGLKSLKARLNSDGSVAEDLKVFAEYIRNQQASSS